MWQNVCINRLVSLYHVKSVIFQSKNWLSSFFKFKDSIPLHLCSHLIYKFQCSNCNITYYSKTERHLKVRAGEYISKSPLTGKIVNNYKKTSVKDHCLLSGHVCSFEDFTVLNHESHKFKRLIKESLLVSKDKPLLNKQVKSLKLEFFWFNSTYAILWYYFRVYIITNSLYCIFCRNIQGSRNGTWI